MPADPADVAERIPGEMLRALHQVEVAAEWVERAFGALLDAHHRTGHAQGLLIEAADSLSDAGREDLARTVRDVAALDAVGGRWTYQMVDEFRSHLLGPVRAMDSAIRNDVSGGARHGFEALQKRRTGGVETGTRAQPPPPGAG